LQQLLWNWEGVVSEMGKIYKMIAIVATFPEIFATLYGHRKINKRSKALQSQELKG
jgi:hypothetical protein